MSFFLLLFLAEEDSEMSKLLGCFLVLSEETVPERAGGQRALLQGGGTI